MTKCLKGERCCRHQHLFWRMKNCVAADSREEETNHNDDVRRESLIFESGDFGISHYFHGVASSSSSCDSPTIYDGVFYSSSYQDMNVPPNWLQVTLTQHVIRTHVENAQHLLFFYVYHPADSGQSILFSCITSNMIPLEMMASFIFRNH